MSYLNELHSCLVFRRSRVWTSSKATLSGWSFWSFTCFLLADVGSESKIMPLTLPVFSYKLYYSPTFLLGLNYWQHY